MSRLTKPSARNDPTIARVETMLAVLMRFRTLVRSMRNHYRSVERACGVSGAYVWAMVEIGANGRLSVGDLAHRLAIHQSTASNMVERLETAGLVARKRDNGDQRIVRLQLTALGRRTVARAPHPHRGVLQDALMKLSTPALVHLGKDLELLLGEMQAGRQAEQSLLLAQVIAGDTDEPPRKQSRKARRVPRRGKQR